MKIAKSALFAGVLTASLCAATLAEAGTTAPAPVVSHDAAGFQAGDIMVRGRMLAVLPSVSSSVSVIGGQVHASNSLTPEADLTYFFTPNLAVEAIAAVTRHHLVDKTGTGTVDLGRTNLLPPTITAQYHFFSQENFRPYVGAGVNYTFFFDSTVPPAGAVTSINYENGWGAALQVGADYHLDGHWFANVDVKHIFLNTKAKINGGAINGYVALDPTIVGLGLGYKF